jgi:hypothetical protein
MLKSFIQTLVLDNLGESSTSPTMILWGCWMVLYHFRTRCNFSVLLLMNITFSTVTFFKMFIMILSSNRRGDVTSRPLLLRITAIEYFDIIFATKILWWGAT